MLIIITTNVGNLRFEYIVVEEHVVDPSKYVIYTIVYTYAYVTKLTYLSMLSIGVNYV